MRPRYALPCVLALVTTLAFALPEDEMPPEMARYWFGLIHKGPAWTAGATPETEALQRAHLENIGRLAASGKLVLAGPFEGGDDLRGVFVYDVETEAEARALVESDPAVAAGRLTVQLIPWWATSALRSLRETPAGEDVGMHAEPAAQRLDGVVVEASCGECQFDLDGDDCTLAIRVDGHAYRVTGTSIDDHGDAHGRDGFCNAIREARVTGRIEGDVFVAESFELQP